MPAEYERRKQEIIAGAKRKYSDWNKWSEERRNAYIFGTLRRMGWVKGASGHMVKRK